MEKVSIIVPCYNGEQFINRCIESIYKQSYPSIELIVVDDGSTDNSKAKINAWNTLFLENGYELKYIYQKNAGPGSAVNTGLKAVTGEYISLIDADDEYLPEAMSERVDFLKKNTHMDVVRTNGWIVRENNKFLFISDEKEKTRQDVFLALLRGETNNWAGSFMVRSKALFKFYSDREIYQSRYGQNLQFLLPLIYKKKCGFIDRPHMNYIQIGNSLCRTDREEELERKSIENAEGYRDIRIHMVRLIVSNLTEQSYYLDMIEAGYYRGIMNIAMQYGNVKLMKEAYSNKKNYEKPSLDDKIDYCRINSPRKVWFYRIMRKLCSIIYK